MREFMIHMAAQVHAAGVGQAGEDPAASGGPQREAPLVMLGGHSSHTHEGCCCFLT